MTISILSTKNATTTLYTFPATGEMEAGWEGGMEIMTDDMEFRSDIIDRNWSDGGVIDGDRLVRGRHLDIAGVVEAPNRGSLLIELNAMKNACYLPGLNCAPDNFYWISATPYSAAPYNHVYKFGGVNRFLVEWITDRAAEITIRLVIPDPHRYEKEETTYGPKSIGTSGQWVDWDVDIGSDVAPIQIPTFNFIVRGGVLGSLGLYNRSAPRANGTNSGMKLDGLKINAPDCGVMVAPSISQVYTYQLDMHGNIPYGNLRVITNHISSGDFPYMVPGVNHLTFRGTSTEVGGGVGMEHYIWLRRRYL